MGIKGISNAVTISPIISDSISPAHHLTPGAQISVAIHRTLSAIDGRDPRRNGLIPRLKDSNLGPLPTLVLAFG
jgi:hypothetical protein